MVPLPESGLTDAPDLPQSQEEAELAATVIQQETCLSAMTVLLRVFGPPVASSRLFRRLTSAAEAYDAKLAQVVPDTAKLDPALAQVRDHLLQAS